MYIKTQIGGVLFLRGSIIMAGTTVIKQEEPSSNIVRKNDATNENNKRRRTSARLADPASGQVKEEMDQKEQKMVKKEEDMMMVANVDDKKDSIKKKLQAYTDLKITASEVSPYPKHSRPSPYECLYVTELLSALHGEPERDQLAENCSGPGTLLEKRARSVLDSLVRTILSQNTTDTLSKRAFEVGAFHVPFACCRSMAMTRINTSIFQTQCHKFTHSP